MYRLLLVIALAFPLSCFAQINPQKLDSLTQAMDSSSKRVQAWQDSFTKKQDSIYRSGISRSGHPPQEYRQPRKWPFLFGLATALVILAIWLWFKRTGRNTNRMGNK